jgi:F-type H+-transporting ATPase subunit b
MEIFPNWTFIPVVFLLLIFIFIARRTFFGPLSRVLQERHSRIEGALVEAEQIRENSQKMLSDFDRKIRDARRESDQQIGQITAEAMQEKNRIVSGKRSEAEGMLTKAKEEIRVKREDAKGKLQSLKEDFARRIASKILKRPIGKQPGKSA